MKVIFLDVDGVLNSQDDLMIRRKENNITGSILYAEVEDRPLKLLKEIVERTDAKVVISSSWRLGCARSEGGSVFCSKLYTKLENRLKEYGIDIYDITPSLNGDTQRGDEIKEWLSKNPTNNFIILDDDDDMREYKEMDNFIQTTYEHGLTDELKDRAIKVLGERNEEK